MFHDVSHYQGDYHPTGPTIAKATEGTGYTDPQFATTRSRTLAGGWPFLGYHFLTPGRITAQVDHAVSVIGRGRPVMLDVESGAGGDAGLQDVLAFADAYAQRGGGGRVTLAYIPKWYWSGQWGSPSLSGVESRGMGLISSEYTTYSDNGPGWQPYGGMTPVIWQYTSTPLDTNAFKGTQAELGQLFTYGTRGDDDMALTDDDKAWLKANIPPAVWDPKYSSVRRPDWSTVTTADSVGARSAFFYIWDLLNPANFSAPVGTLSEADKDDIARRVADLLAQRLRE